MKELKVILALRLTICSLTELFSPTVPKLWKWIPSIQVRYNRTPSFCELREPYQYHGWMYYLFAAGLLWMMIRNSVHSVLSHSQVNWRHQESDSYELGIFYSFNRLSELLKILRHVILLVLILLCYVILEMLTV